MQKTKGSDAIYPTRYDAEKSKELLESVEIR
jgi:hypothetical protein